MFNVGVIEAVFLTENVVPCRSDVGCDGYVGACRVSKKNSNLFSFN